MAARITFCFAVAISFVAGSNTATALQVPPPAYELAARHAGIPPNVLFVIALQESGTNLHGRLIPWPWTLNIAGAPERYTNRAQACSALRDALERVPATRVDAGLGQVNVGYHGDRVEQPCALLDPYRNLAITATLLREQHTPGDDWLIAVGRYHRPAGGAPALRYQRSVLAHLTRVLGSSTTASTWQETPP
jgi:hypothetical protein